MMRSMSTHNRRLTNGSRHSLGDTNRADRATWTGVNPF
jgi:hypothetical protein